MFEKYSSQTRCSFNVKVPSSDAFISNCNSSVSIYLKFKTIELDKLKYILFLHKTMAFVCELDTGYRVYLDNQGTKTIVTSCSSQPGQQQQASSVMETGVWTAPPEAYRSGNGAILKISTAEGDRFAYVQGSSMSVMGASPSLGGAQQMQVQQTASVPTPSMPPMQPMQPMQEVKMGGMQPMQEVKMDGMPPMQPMQPMQPMKMGDMTMSTNPMAMSMGNMSMSMGGASTNAARGAVGTRQFCSQCGAKVDPNDRFCSSCGHALGA